MLLQWKMKISKKMVDDLDDHEKIEFDKEMSSITLSKSVRLTDLIIAEIITPLC